MAIFTKSLSELIEAALEKKQKIESRIQELKAEEDEIKTSLQSLTDDLLEFELAEDTIGQAKCKKSIQTLRGKMTDVQGMIASYENKLAAGILTDKESQKIRDAFSKSQAEKAQKVKPLLDEKEAAKKQIAALELKIKNIEHQVSILQSRSSNEETQLQRILNSIDPRTEKLDWMQKKQFVKEWITSGSTEHFFESKSERKGPTMIDRSTHEPEPKDPMKEVIQVQYTDKYGNPTTERMTRKEAQERKSR